MQPFRMCLLTDYLGTLAGTEANIVGTAVELVRSGVDVRVAVYPRHEPVHPYWLNVLTDAGVTVWKVAHGSDELVFFGELQRWLATWSPHIVHAIPMGQLVVGWFDNVALSRSAPLIATETSEASSRCTWYDPDQFSRFARLAAVIAPSASVAAGVRDFLRFPGRVQVIPFVVRVPDDRVCPLTHKDLACVRHLGAITRLRVEKGIEFLLASIRMLSQTHDVKLTIYGETPELARTQELIRAIGVASRVHVAGPFRGEDEMERVISSHCVFLLSSLFEGQPLV